MTSPPFDTLRIAQALRDAGFDNGQAEAVVAAIQQSLGEQVATKSDISDLRGDMRTGMEKLRADMYRALWIQGAGLVMITVAVAGVAVAIAKAIS